MAKIFYNCPLCQKQSAYISEYGMQDSVICKCKGLNEVGRLVNGQYQPHKMNATPGVLSNGQPIVTKKDEFAPMTPRSIPPVLPQGQANRPGIVAANSIIQAGSFTIYHLAIESEVEAAGRYFQNALSSATGRQRFMAVGDIYYAEHATDETHSLMFYIEKTTGDAVNFYGKQNRSCEPTDVDQVKQALRKLNLIKN